MPVEKQQKVLLFWFPLIKRTAEVTLNVLLTWKSFVGVAAMQFLLQCLHCDNAGKNQAFEKTCKQNGLGIDFEYTAPGTPQQNGWVEHKVAMLFKRVHAMLNSGKFTIYLQSSLRMEAANTAMLLNNNLITPNRTLSPSPHFWEGKEKWPNLNAKIWLKEHCHLQEQ